MPRSIHVYRNNPGASFIYFPTGPAYAQSATIHDGHISRSALPAALNATAPPAKLVAPPTEFRFLLVDSGCGPELTNLLLRICYVGLQSPV
jgi:hypothetical protein